MATASMSQFDQVVAGSMESAHTALDVIGIIDPFGFADLLNAGLYAAERDWRNAGISVAGAALPYAGDALKFTRIGKAVIKQATAVAD